MIQQRLLWANFSACFCFSPADQQMAGALAALIKAALFLIAGMQVFWLSTQTNAIQVLNATLQWGSNFVSLICFIWRLCFICALERHLPLQQDPGQAGVKALGYKGGEGI